MQLFVPVAMMVPQCIASMPHPQQCRPADADCCGRARDSTLCASNSLGTLRQMCTAGHSAASFGIWPDAVNCQTTSNCCWPHVAFVTGFVCCLELAEDLRCRVCCHIVTCSAFIYHKQAPYTGGETHIAACASVSVKRAVAAV